LPLQIGVGKSVLENFHEIEDMKLHMSLEWPTS
jgi:hypothetical protein